MELFTEKKIRYKLIISNFGEAITNRLFLSYLISRDSKVN